MCQDGPRTSPPNPETIVKNNEKYARVRSDMTTNVGIDLSRNAVDLFECLCPRMARATRQNPIQSRFPGDQSPSDDHQPDGHYIQKSGKFGKYMILYGFNMAFIWILICFFHMVLYGFHLIL